MINQKELERRKKISKTLTGRRLSEETKEKVSKNNARYWSGKKRSIITKQKISNSYGGKNNFVRSPEYQRIHRWIAKKLGYPNTCENCGKTNLFGRKIHWANKSQEYKLQTNDWMRLCKSCHVNYDINHKTEKLANNVR